MNTASQNIDAPDASPSLLGHAPTRGVGVRRLNNVPKYIAIGLGVSVVALMMYATIARGNQQYKKTDTSLKASQSSTPPREVAQTQDPNIAQTALPLKDVAVSNTAQGNQVPSINDPQQQQIPPSNSNVTPSPSPPPPSPYADQWATYKQKQTSANQTRESALTAALNAPTNVQSSSSNNSNSASNLVYGAGTSVGAGQNPSGASDSAGDNDSEFNGQYAKRNFLQQRNYASNYSSASKMPAISPMN